MSVFTSEERLSDGGGLPVGPCPTCEREVVAYLVDADDGPIHACVHCDGPLRRVDWIDEGQLGRLGYDLSDPLATKGCATGCASGGCAAKGRAS
ncbi:MAG TPA: hypothetical protein VNE71_15825 [Myxococcota bacterium]|nr:hypothetical protein [Myxococcota bacterium]